MQIFSLHWIMQNIRLFNVSKKPKHWIMQNIRLFNVSKKPKHWIMQNIRLFNVSEKPFGFLETLKSLNFSIYGPLLLTDAISTELWCIDPYGL